MVLEEAGHALQSRLNRKPDIFIPWHGRGAVTRIGDSTSSSPGLQSKALICIFCLQDPVVAAKLAPFLDNVETVDAG